VVATSHKEGDLYIYICPNKKCGYVRQQIMDSDVYSTNCSYCWSAYCAIKIGNKDDEVLKKKEQK
jgi:hypothetical protein